MGRASEWGPGDQGEKGEKEEERKPTKPIKRLFIEKANRDREIEIESKQTKEKLD
jgi:hypothetical protein